MITAVIGHRGTGKTELMSRMQFYLRDTKAQLLDLDIEIEKKIGKGIRELFLEHGEAYFREMERQVFLEILQTAAEELYIVLGAGCDLSIVPESVRVLWVRRTTDKDGRIFLNRPRLNPELSPLEEFRHRSVPREENYRARADEIYLMPEGVFQHRHQAMSVEKSILTYQTENIGGCLTITPDIFQSEFRWELFKKRLSGKGISYFELRDDFLTLEQIQKVITEMPAEKFLFSFRKPPTSESLWQTAEGLALLSHMHLIDWAWELGTPDDLLSVLPKEKIVLSLHGGKDSAYFEYETKVSHLKWAPLVSSFADLKAGHLWQKENASARSFLPRSADGRWEWYRRLQKGHQLINFWKEGEGSAGDQPSLWAWLMTPNKSTTFAAVLGDPVSHSYTPLEHSDFFWKKNMPVFAIRIGRASWDESFPVIQELGLTYAAVTSPHKENAAQAVADTSLQAVNTLFWNAKTSQWLGTSTDDQGFAALTEGMGMISPLQKEIFVWGGGGVLEMVQKNIAHASFFSSRTCKPRPGSEDAEALQPKILIWAAPRSSETLMPPTSWKPMMVFDLNYKEDSMGKEYAQLLGVNYESGLLMFTEQAQGQRAFWKACEESI